MPIDEQQLALALAPTAELAELEAVAALPRSSDVDPRELYLATLTESTRATAASTVRKLAELLVPGFVQAHGVELVPWHMLRYPHVVAVRSALTASVDAHRVKRRTANRYLSTLRAVLRHAWLAEQMPEDAYRKAIEGTIAIDGEDLPAGRTITSGEARALFEVCATGTMAGARDAALLAILLGAGLRRAEASSLELGNFDRETGVLRFVGKRRRERTAYLAGGAFEAVTRWLEVRAAAGLPADAGSLLCPVRKGGRVENKPFALRSINDRVDWLAKRAGLHRGISPHDFRRTGVTTIAEEQGVLAAQAWAGHKRLATTETYIRDDKDAAREKASEAIHVPYRAPSED